MLCEQEKWYKLIKSILHQLSKFCKIKEKSQSACGKRSWYNSAIMRARVLIALAGLFVFFTALLVPSVSAQEEYPYGYKITEEEIQEYRNAIENCDTPSLECLVRNVSRFTAIEWINEITGADGFLSGTADSGEGPQYAQSGGVLTTLGYFIGSMYARPPAQTNVYVADLIDSTGLVEPAYAQGLGFASLDPILDLWKKFRNVSYFFFIILFIVIGFMIMFRQKIGGQTAVTVQQAIPSVIMSLIFVTFSYAIAGFMIDLMYLFMYLIIGVFGSSLSGLDVAAQDIIGFNIFQLVGMLINRISLQGGFEQNRMLAEQMVVNFGLAENAFTEFLGFGGGLIVSLVIGVAVLIAGFKLFFELLKSYASIIFAVVAAPIILMFGALPGRNVFSGWIKGLIGNLIAFPTVLLMLVLFLEFTRSVETARPGGFIPPFLVGGGQSSIVGPLLGFAVILALPEIVKKMKESFGASDGFGMMLAGWAGTRFKEGEVGIPLATGVLGGAGGIVSSGIAAVGKKSFGSWARNDLLRGTSVGDGRTRGGLLTGASRGWNQGQKVRKTIDRASEGRLWDPENTEQLLSKLVQGQQGGKKEEEVAPKATDKP